MTLRSALLAVAAVYLSLPASATSTLSTTDIAALRPYTYYASTGYCRPPDTLSWRCGPNCKANPQFKPVASGGNGNDAQFWYAGYDPTLDSVIVAHQGLDFNMEHALMAVMELEMSDIDPIFFPGLASRGIAVHTGFMHIHSKFVFDASLDAQDTDLAGNSAVDDVYAAIKETREKYPTNTVTFVGHSLGAALGVLDAVFLSLNMPDVSIKAIGYGMPRIGNTAFADYVDEHVNVTRINNKWAPYLSLTFCQTYLFGLDSTRYQLSHPLNTGIITLQEKLYVIFLIPHTRRFTISTRHQHILETGDWNICKGQENDDGTCSAGAISHMFAGAITDHPGPYDGVMIGCELPVVPETTTANGMKVEHVIVPSNEEKEKETIVDTTPEQVVLTNKAANEDAQPSPMASVHETEL
ncbi:hypothetical protein ONZ45_g4465 [Pleurotus djamor]|nr:hypothetical protein ONZ45_g4465 [Pleurotus djamor]